MRVLIVDHSRATRLVSRNLFTRLGFEVTEADDALAALHALQNGSKFDLVLVDWLMPEVDGLKFIRRIRSDERTSNLRVVLVGEQEMSDHLDEALDAGADEYILKPFTLPMLSSKLDLLGLEHK